jgi:hypothetical protein
MRAYFVKIFLTSIPVPSLSSEFDPVIIGPMTTPNPSVVVEARATAENLAARVRLLHSSVVGSVDECSFETPVVLTSTEFESAARSGDHVDLAGVGWAGFDDCHGNIGVLCETSGYGVASRAT